MAGNPGKPDKLDLEDDGLPTFIAQRPLTTFEDYALLVAMHAFVSAQPLAHVDLIVKRSRLIADSLSSRREEDLAARREKG